MKSTNPNTPEAIITEAATVASGMGLDFDATWNSVNVISCSVFPENHPCPVASSIRRRQVL